MLASGVFSPLSATTVYSLAVPVGRASLNLSWGGLASARKLHDVISPSAGTGYSSQVRSSPHAAAPLPGVNVSPTVTAPLAPGAEIAHSAPTPRTTAQLFFTRFSTALPSIASSIAGGGLGGL